MILSHLYNIYNYINSLLTKFIKREDEPEPLQIENKPEQPQLVEQPIDNTTVLLKELKELKEIQEMNIMIISDMILKSNSIEFLQYYIE
jgi:hypothetical protein